MVMKNRKKHYKNKSVQGNNHHLIKKTSDKNASKAATTFF